MSEEPRKTIVITKEELRDPKIDEIIALGRSSGSRDVQPSEQRHRFRLVYASWFYLLLAGALGAFAAWALIEPYYDELPTFTGRIEQVEPGKQPPTFSHRVYTIWGRIRVSGVDVYLFREGTQIADERGKAIPSAFDALKSGQVVQVMGFVAPDKTSLGAVVVGLQKPDVPVTSRVNVSTLETQQHVFAFALFPTVAALVGLMVGSVEGIVCRTFPRAAWCGAVGLLSGLVGGAISSLVGGLIFVFIGWLGADVVNPRASALAFVFLMFRRGLAWTVVGMTAGLGQGFALQSGKLVLNGFIGGMVGGLLGGLLFDPINVMIADQTVMQGAEVSRAIGITIIGGAVGLMIGFTEMLTRDAWLKVLQGPLRGKEFSFNRTPIRLGSSPRNEIYLFKDPKIAPIHAEINKLRDTYELVDQDSSTGTFVNGQRIKRHRLADQDVIRIGDAEFRYMTRERVHQ